MFVLGHVGFGIELTRALWRGRREPVALVVGTLLPDLIDKPLYYGLSWYTGKWGADLGAINCTRTVGHTGALMLLILMLSAFSARSRSRSMSSAILCLGLGMATHLLLDNLLFLVSWLIEGAPGDASAWVALTWPLNGPFIPIKYTGMQEHADALVRPMILVPELLGACLIYRNRELFRRASASGG